MKTQDRMDQSHSMIEHRDGLADIFLGLVIITFSLGILTEMIWFTGGAVAIFTPLWLNAKAQITAPRLKQAGQQTRPHARQTILGMLFFLAGIVLLVLILFALPALYQLGEGLISWLRTYIDLGIGLILAALMALLSAILAARRFLAYAALTLVFFIAANLLGLPLWLVTALTGTLILLVGIVILAQFVRQNPL